MLFRLTRDLFALLVQQSANISTDTERRAGLSAIAKPLAVLVLFIIFLLLASCDRLSCLLISYSAHVSNIIPYKRDIKSLYIVAHLGL